MNKKLVLYLIIIFRIYNYTSVAQSSYSKMGCDSIIFNTLDLIEKGELSEDLAPLFLDYIPSYCPHTATGPDIDEVCKENFLISEKDIPPNEEWNGVDYRDIIIHLIIDYKNYQVCKDILNDSSFLEIIKNIEPLDGKKKDSYDLLRISSISFFWASTILDVLQNYDFDTTKIYQKDDFDITQLRLLKVIDYVESWNYCTNFKYYYLNFGKPSNVLAEFDRFNKRLNFYRGFCSETNIYGLNIVKISGTHRALLIVCHELGHIVDYLSNASNNNSESEVRATYIGTYFAQSFARLFYLMALSYYKAASISDNLENKDLSFLLCQKEKWAEMEKFILNIRNEIKINKDYIPKNWRMIQSCISY